jgi:uncharacterized protein YcbK (DUF882 family)
MHLAFRVASSALCALALGVVTPSRGAAQSRTNPDIDADRVYVVMPGDTLFRIAARLGVTARALAERNRIPRPYSLSVGRRLRLPEGIAPEVLRRLPTREEASGGASGTNAGASANPGDPQARPHRPGFATLTRVRDGQELSTNFSVAGQALRMRVERFLRARDNRQHMVHPRLMRVFGPLSDRFGGRRIVVLSGYRPPQRGEPISRHNQGYAVDLRVEGAELRQVWEFCKTLPNMGCGLYLRSNYVHFDVRTAAEDWQGPQRRRGQPVSVIDPDHDEDPAEVTADAAPSENAR